MRVVFLSPTYPAEMRQFTRGLAEVGAEVLGVGDGNPDAELRCYLTDYLQVPAIMDEDDVIARVHAWLRGRNVDRVLANWEPLVIVAARLRERFGLPGMSVDTVRGFRDKQLMKERVAAAGLRVPRSQRVRTIQDAWAALEITGYPSIIKPISGAGSADTYKVESANDMERVLPHMRHITEASCEEFIEGEEYTYDTACIAGAPAYESVTQYLPNALEMRSLEWVSPIMLSVRDLQQPHVTAGIELGRKVLGALGMGDGMTHMEWFRKPDGEVVFGEIACRPGGACVVDLINYTSDIDMFREWARVVTVGRFEATTARAYNVGIIFKRAQGQGRITNIVGLRDYLARHGAHVVEDTLLRPGTSRRDWRSTLLSDGYLIVRHPDWDQARAMAMAAATDIQLYAA
jgi:biotin carboxylase